MSSIIEKIVVILLFVLLFGCIGYIAYLSISENKICTNTGFDYQTDFSSRDIEPGYIKCCNSVYEEHIAKEVCEVIKK